MNWTDVPGIDPLFRPTLRAGLATGAVCALGLALLVAVPQLHFTVPQPVNVAFHALVEIVSIVICFMVFSLGWATYGRQQGSAVALISSVFLAAGILDLVHMLSFAGMPALGTPSGGGKAIPSFLTARLMVALAMVALAFMPQQGTPGRAVRVGLLGGSVAIALGVSAVSLTDPAIGTLFFNAGSGLTPLKIAIEYGVVLLHIAAIAGFARRLGQPADMPIAHLLVANGLMGLSEFCFTLYSTPADHYINYAHVLKIVSYALLWHAMFRTAVVRPYVDLALARDELQAGERRYRLLFERNLSAVLVCERRGRVLHANPAAQRLLGATQSLAGTPAQKILDGRDSRVFALEAVLDRTGFAHGELRMRRIDGSFFEGEIDGAMYVDDSGATIINVVFRDVTERNRARTEILQLNATLEQRVRERTVQLEAVNRELEAFSFTVAHDLRQPLAGIRMFHKVLTQRVAGRIDATGADMLERIGETVQHLDEIIVRLLELAQVSRSPVQRQSVDLAAIVEDVRESLQATAPQRQVAWCVQHPMHTHADARLVRMVLENLLGNAWKFTGQRDGARIDVGCSTGTHGEQVFHVRDNGAGFDPALAGKLFAPFQRLHSGKDFPGHGVGLASVSRIIDMHGGRIWAEGRPGEGASFHFTLEPRETA